LLICFFSSCLSLASNLRLPVRVPLDTGVEYIDRNSHYLNSSNTSCLEPLLQSARVLSPSFEYPSIDIVTDRNNLRKLLRFITSEVTEDFRIDAELVGEKTMLLGRWERRTVNPDDGVKRGYAQDFVRTMTKQAKGCEGSVGHHRIIEYVD
jgi:hypothetical protein